MARSLHSHIESNKRKSFFLIFIVISLVIGIVTLYSWYIRGDLVLPIIAAALIVPTSLFGYYKGDRVALAANGARPLSKEAGRELHNIVENLAITAGLPKPDIYIINSPALNAFATGRNPEHASIAVTRGLVEHLDRSELEGVLAHELAHVKNYDIRFSTIVAIFVGFLILLSDIFLRMMFWGGLRGNRGGKSSGNAGAIVMIAALALMIISPIIAKVIQLAISRQREYLADASGSLLTRYPEGLASALTKIASGPELKTAGNATAHLYTASPFKKKTYSHLFSTHPPIDERIKRLRELNI